MKNIEQYFSDLRVMDPVATDEQYGTTMKKKDLQSVRAVVFDVYGTLLVSSAGDVNEFKHGKENVLAAFKKTGMELNGQIMDLDFGETVIREYLNTIQRHHLKKKDQGVEFPEVIIEDVWKEVLDALAGWEVITPGGHCDPRTLALVFELLSNPCYPMPGFRKVLERLDNDEYTLGITSNAQFYTPMILKYFLGEKEFLSERGIPFFKDELVKLSYREDCAKPGWSIFQSMHDALAKENILPSQVLFVGNDMFNDIYPAGKTGFRTALFAGDKRSLRMRKYLPEVKDLAPDAVITDLRQIPELLGL